MVSHSFISDQDRFTFIEICSARHEGDLIPAKLKPSHGVAYVAYGGGEYGKSDYEVLVGCHPQWIRCQGNAIPPQAVPAGETSDGEKLYVGRASHEGTLQLGKVQKSHSCCYISYGNDVTILLTKIHLK